MPEESTAPDLVELGRLSSEAVSSGDLDAMVSFLARLGPLASRNGNAVIDVRREHIRRRESVSSGCLEAGAKGARLGSGWEVR